MQYLWFMSRTETLSDELYNQMMATAQAKLPNYDFSQLMQDKHGHKCSYVKK